jgi:hypothetical protein
MPSLLRLTFDRLDDAERARAALVADGSLGERMGGTAL